MEEYMVVFPESKWPHNAELVRLGTSLSSLYSYGTPTSCSLISIFIHHALMTNLVI